MSGERSAEDACREALERLEAENPRINAVVAWDGERALAEARERDGLPHVWRGPLHGVPFTAKDLTDATPYATTYGSLAFADNVPGADAACVARLRRAGAVLIGKTNTPEMGARPTTENLLFGITRNPHDETRTPGGSSGGAAAALAAGIGTLAQGSDGGGSIRIPAACCGVVGHKPTRGLVSGAPATYDAWEGLATNGPIARTVADCALMLEVMAGPEPGDAYFAAAARRRLRRPPVSRIPAPLRIGVLREPPRGSLDRELGAIFDSCGGDARAHGPPARGPRRAAGGAVRARSRRSCSASAPPTGRSCRPSAGISSSRSMREAVLDGERIGAGEYVQAVAAARRGTAAVLEALASVRARRLPRAHAAGRAARRSSPSTPAAASAGASTSTGTPTPCPTTSPASPRSPCPAARPPRACRSDCRSSGRRATMRSCSRLPPPSSGRYRLEHRDAADLGVAEASAPDRRRRALGHRARRRLPGAHRASATGRTATRAIRPRSTPGCGSTRRARWPRPRAPTSTGRARAQYRAPPLALGHPDRPQGSLRGRRRAADRLELPARRGTGRPTATSGRACAPRA